MAQVRWAWSKGRRPSGAVLHSSREPGVRRPCSDFVDMLRRLISNTTAYVKPRCRTKFGERGFCYAGPDAWNSLPQHLHQINDTGLFKCRQKTELFRRAYQC